MKTVQQFMRASLLLFLSPALGHALAQVIQSDAPIASTAQSVVPALVRYAGVVPGAKGKTGSASITFQIFTDEQGGEPLWVETQQVTFDATGRYEVQLGATGVRGLPSELFANGEARWLEVQVGGSTPQARVVLASVPYAMKTADAATLGGLPASAFALTSDRPIESATQPAGVTPDAGTAVTTTGGTTGYLPVYSGTSTIDNSLLSQSGTKVGVGTTSPASTLDVSGPLDVRGPLTIESSGTATSSTGTNSHPLDLNVSTYNSGSKTAQIATFALQAEPTGNDTASPGSSLNLLYGLAATPAETGFKISSKGLLTFASGQTFGSTAGSGNAVTGTSTSGTGVAGTSTSGDGVLGGTAGGTGGTAGVLGVAGSGTTESFTGIAGVWGNASAHIGVLGSSNQYAGVEGVSGTGQGVWGQSTSSFGVEGTSTSHDGVFGTASTASGVLGITAGTTLGSAGTLGTAGTRTSFNGIAGVWGDASLHVGVYGTSTTNTGVYGASSNNIGVQGSSVNGTAGYFTTAGPLTTIPVANTNTGADGALTIYAYSTGRDADAIEALASGAGSAAVAAFAGYPAAVYGSASVNGIGVEGLSDVGMGVVGRVVSTSAVGVGFANDQAAIWADSGTNPNETDINGTLMAFADDNRAALMANNSNDFPTLNIQNNASENFAGSATPNLLRASGKDGSCGINVRGDLRCTGQVKMLATTSGARMLETYAVHSPENWVEDFGSGTLHDGSTTIAIDPTFAQTANTAIDYHILLTPRGDTRTLYVANLTAGSFEVHESSHGTSTVAFDYRIVAKRKGYEGQRLEDVTEKVHAENVRYALPDRTSKQRRQNIARRAPAVHTVR